MAKKNATKNDNKVSRETFIALYEMFSALNDVNGVKVTPIAPTGVKGNDGFTIQFGDSYAEVWDNSDMTTSNVAFRPMPNLAKSLFIDLDKINAVKGIKVSTPKKEKTVRIRLYDSKVLNNYMHRIAVTLRTLAETTPAKKDVTAKKVEVVA